MTKYLKTHYILNDSIGCNQARGFPLQTTENKSDVTCKYCIKEHKIEQKLSVRKFNVYVSCMVRLFAINFSTTSSVHCPCHLLW